MDLSRSTLRVMAGGIYRMLFPSGFRPPSVSVGVRMEGETRVSIQSMEGGKLVLSNAKAVHEALQQSLGAHLEFSIYEG
jgi:hypothetical protein